MIDLDYITNVAQKVAKKSPCRFKVACVLTDKRGNVVATGFNHRGNGRGRMGHWTTHAEADALNKVRKPSSNLIAFIYRKNRRLITPCRGCAKLLKAYGIRTVWHTTGDEKEEWKNG